MKKRGMKNGFLKAFFNVEYYRWGATSCSALMLMVYLLVLLTTVPPFFYLVMALLFFLSSVIINVLYPLPKEEPIDLLEVLRGHK